MGNALFGYGNTFETQKLSKMLINAKAVQVSTDVAAITPVWKDPVIVNTIKKRLALVSEFKRIDAPESTYRWEKNSADNFGKFAPEATAVSAFAAQKGTYAESTASCKLLTYKMQIGLIAQKNVAQPGSPFNLVQEEQKLAAYGINKAIERCTILGNPAAAAADGSQDDSNAFNGLQKSITTNVDTPSSAEAISLEKLDDQIDAIKDYGVPENELMMVTDAFTKTKIASLFYNTYNTPMDKIAINAGFEINSYRNVPIFDSGYMPTGADVRELFITHKETTVLAEFWKMSQIELGRTELSDDSAMFWMGTLAVKDEPANAWIKKIKS